MKKVTLVEYLTLCFAAKLYFIRSWRVRVLMRLTEYPVGDELTLFKDGDDYVFTHNGETFKLDVAKDKAPCNWSTPLKLPKGFLPNISKDIDTTFGILLVNTLAFAEEFGDLIPYINSEIKTDMFHKEYYRLYKAGKIERSSQLLNSAGYIHILEADAEFGVPSASIETFTTHPDMKKVVKEQLEKYKDTLDQPTTHAKIDAVTTQLDRDYVKGTQAEKFLISGKMHDVVRKQSKIMHGSSTGMDGLPTPLITRPLEEGLDLGQMPNWVDVARNGSFARGGLTALSGYGVKTDELTYGHLEVAVGVDCKTKKGLTVDVQDYNKSQFEGMRLLKDNEPLTLTQLDKLVGKFIVIRAPSKCALETDYCEYCMGLLGGKARLGIPSGVITIDSNSMNAQMQAAHGKASKAVKVNLTEMLR